MMERRPAVMLPALVLVLAAAPLGAVQVASSLAVREVAVRGSWMSAVAPARAAHFEERAEDFPLPPALQLVLARHALAAGNFALAERLVARLPPFSDRSALAGALAERRGDAAAAIAAYLAARDVDDLERVVERLQREEKIGEAVSYQRALVDELERDPTQTGALPQAYYHLGLLEESLAYHTRFGSQLRTAYERQALAYYLHAVTLAPLAERYWIASGNQQLNLSDLNAAGSSFRKALDINPRSAEALVGLADIAARRGAVREARALLDRAARIDPNAQSLRRLRATLP